MITGGCLCGAIRYSRIRRTRFTSYCHCEDCRKASGAPVVAWTFFPRDPSNGTRAEATLAHCRTRTHLLSGLRNPLSFFDPAIPGEFEVTTCSLDHPEDFPPQDHNWSLDRLPWFETADPLPRHATYTPE